MNNKSSKRLIIFIIIGVIGAFILNSISNDSRLEKEGILAVATVEKITASFKSASSISYSYVLNGEKYYGSDNFSRLDRKHYSIGDKILLLYLVNENSVSKLYKDKQKNLILYINSNQLDSLNNLRSK
jgi:hypothetical protein